jgi:hypothetical protein
MSEFNVAAMLERQADTDVETRTVETKFGDVVVRSLTRAQVLSIQKAGPVDAAVMERKLLAFALVEPKLNRAQIEHWQNTSPAGELQPIVAAIEELSGLREREVGEDGEPVKPLKEEIKSFRE